MRRVLNKINENVDEEDYIEIIDDQDVCEGISGEMTAEEIAKKHNVSIEDINKQLDKGIKVEKEHTNDEEKARRIALDHLFEIPDYYDKLDKMEKDALKEKYALTAYGYYNVGDLVSFKDDNKLRHGMILDIDERCDETKAPIGVWVLDDWGVIDTPVKNIIKKISENELSEKERKNYSDSAKGFADKRIAEIKELKEDTIKTKSGKWTNKGDTGETHGTFKTKKAADAQRRAIWVNWDK